MRIFSPIALTVVLLCAVVPRADAEEPHGEWPLRPQPEVIERFDAPDSPYGAGHRGVDLLGHVGQTIHASLAGTVTFVGMLAGRGVVVVDHGDTRTTYEPVTASVTVATPVAAGAPIGTLELARSHCLPRSCLHWGWLAGETYLDPLRLVGSGPVRLLPLWRDEPVGDPSAEPMMVAEHAPRPRNKVATGVSRPGERPRVADAMSPFGTLSYQHWQTPLASLTYARGCACW